MRKIVISGNWKMNTDAIEAENLATAMNSLASNVVEIVICPPNLFTQSVVHAVAKSGVQVGVQNLHQKESGAFTGEISAKMVKSVGATHAIIGHSERRQYFNETDASVNEKISQALAYGLTPIVCIGETLAERESGAAFEVVKGQVLGAIGNFSASDLAEIIWAYEPVWAIGTGVTASPEQAQEMHAAIRMWLVERLGADIAQNQRILYGGSMNDANAAELLAQTDIDGGLIGGASLKADAFGKIIAAAIAQS